MIFARRSTLLAFAGLALFWGATYPIVKVALAYAPPLLFASLRMLAGGCVMTLIAFFIGGKLDLRRTWPMFLISALFNAFLFIGLQSFSLVYLPSGLTAVLVYTQPIIVGVLAWFFLGESLTFQKILGLLLGFVGVFVISLQRMADTFSLLGLLFGLATALCWAAGTIYIKKIEGKVSLIWMSGLQLLISGAVMLPLGHSFESWSDINWALPFWFGLLYTGIVGSAVAWFLWAYIVAAGEASRVSSFMFVVPFVSVLIGILFLHESFGFHFVSGAALILFGIFLVNSRPLLLRRQLPRTTDTSV